ncbi:hypothetical protein Ocin01_14667 [Orchesella cincta]|uniref:Uncharacterized protein n=1 Tax=Orchesella cincta TaxID=48709 RepID=A0A1D2MGH7_ORCCI|nr:hypothetical protein Ocin01_14667 [Orchesella cincta]
MALFRYLMVFASLFNTILAGTEVELFSLPNFDGGVNTAYVPNVGCMDVAVGGGSLRFGGGGCMIAYQDKDCKVGGFVIWTEFYDLPKLSQQYYSGVPSFKLRSLRECSDMELRSTVDVDFFEGDIGSGGKKIEIRNLNNCTPVPLFTDWNDGLHNIVSYGKCVKLYKSKYCLGPPDPYYMNVIPSQFTKDLGYLSMEPCHEGTLDFFTEKNFKGIRWQTYLRYFGIAENFPIDFVALSMKTTVCTRLKASPWLDDLTYVINSEEKDLQNLPFKYKSYPGGLVPYIFTHVDTCDSIYETGPTYNVELWYWHNKEHTETPYYNLCRCQEIPEKAQGYNTVIYGYGKCFNVYTTKNCRGAPDSVRHSYAIYKQHEEDDPWLSLEPCSIDAAVSCLRIHARVFSMERISSTHDFAGTRADFAMAATQTFYNDGFGTIEKAIKVSKEVTQTASMEYTEGFRHMHTFQYTFTSTATFEAEIPLLGTAGGSISHQLSTNNEWEYTYNNVSKTETSTKETFTIEETLIIKPCMKYEVSSTVRMTKNAAMTFTQWFEITGRTGTNKKLTIQEIKLYVEKNSPDIIIIPGHEKENKYTLVGQSTVVLTYDYNTEVILTATGEPLPACIERHKDSISLWNK